METLNFNKTGNPTEVLKVVKKEKPTPGDNETLIKVSGSPIHPADVMFIKGRYRFKPIFPQTAGLEGAGLVEASGEKVRSMTGKLVAFIAQGAWAEYVLVSNESFFVLPDDFPIDKAAQFVLNPISAWGLLERSKLKEGEWLMLTAPNSTVSRLLLQFAKLRKIKVAAVVRDFSQAADLSALGADALIQAADEQFSEKINIITSGRGIDAVLDSVGGNTTTNILKNMAINGRLIIYGLLSADPVQFFNDQVIFKNLEIKSFGVRSFLQSLTQFQKDQMIRTLIEEMGKVSFELPVAGTFKLEQFKEALAENEKHGRKGKILFKN